MNDWNLWFPYAQFEVIDKDGNALPKYLVSTVHYKGEERGKSSVCYYCNYPAWHMNVMVRAWDDFDLMSGFERLPFCSDRRVHMMWLMIIMGDDAEMKYLDYA